MLVLIPIDFVHCNKENFKKHIWVWKSLIYRPWSDGWGRAYSALKWAALGSSTLECLGAPSLQRPRTGSNHPDDRLPGSMAGNIPKLLLHHPHSWGRDPGVLHHGKTSKMQGGGLMVFVFVFALVFLLFGLVPEWPWATCQVCLFGRASGKQFGVALGPVQTSCLFRIVMFLCPFVGTKSTQGVPFDYYQCSLLLTYCI